MKEFSIQGLRQCEGLHDKLQPLKTKIEETLFASSSYEIEKPLNITGNLLQRLALAAGLSLTDPRSVTDIENVVISKTGQRIHDTTFQLANLQHLWAALLKLRYKDITSIDWDNAAQRSRVVNYEMIRGMEYLLKDNNLEAWLAVSGTGAASFGNIPFLNLEIGFYEDELEANLNLNGRDIPNTQILIAGTTGSGKSNLLAVLINEMRTITSETSYPINFLLFDYKGEFSDFKNNNWASLFEIDESAVLDPTRQPLPFSPFKDFRGKTQIDINLYATELANALLAIDEAKISANMGNRLTEAVIDAYTQTAAAPITFESVLKAYENRQPEKERPKDDSVKSVLKQLMRNKLFSDTDTVDLIKNSFIVKMDAFPKDGPVAKAIVYFIISKLTMIYEKLPKQAVSDECVELRHFTIIDEAHYMLDFDNRPLRELIAVGRNKGLSIILATQNMESFKSKHFDFYANAQYPLIMKQQSIHDGVIKDLFGVSGQEFHEVKEAISGLKLGELIVKDPTGVILGIGKKYKKLKVKRLG